MRTPRASAPSAVQAAAFCLLALAFTSAISPAQTLPAESPQFRTVVIPTGADPDVVAVADVNHDGAPDIIAANPQSGTITVLLADGKGHFHPAVSSPFAAGRPLSSGSAGSFSSQASRATFSQPS